jgi:NAD(P)-dependent dehydrogenase (short-subunit alcohol dehydrogenase family)
MDLGIAGKVAVVTGAGAGIGRGIVLSLAREGARVVAVSLKQAELDSLKAELVGLDQEHVFIQRDLMEENVPRALMDELREKVGRVDILVNNVGGSLEISDPFCSLDDWRRVWRLNLEIAVELGGAVIPQMQQGGWGRVVNVSSISGAENHGPIPYCSAKAALIAYTRSMGRLVSPDGVIITAVLPGAVYTEGGYWDKAKAERPEHVRKYLVDRMAIHRFGTVDEISGMVTFLCSEQASFCVGSIVPIDGGQGRTFFGV